MSYLVLARRWRPKQFSDLVGQDVVVRTLQNALSGQSLAHAYLLTGIRGVGKTTIARLMAMSVNCSNASNGEPCTECDACTSIMTGSNLDVQEMDAASHTGVDDIREILDGVRYPPASLKYRVYIIDEAHMLSKNAFNALLKTLEEPPAHVLFILATTEIEKLPITVRSRCQRFDLRRLGVDEISGYLEAVLGKEGIESNVSALHAIARAADGSVRDALSLTERVLAYSGKNISHEDVQHALGLVGQDLVRDLTTSTLSGDSQEAVTSLRNAVHAGHAPRALLQSLGETLHRISCLKVSKELLADGFDSSERDWLDSMAKGWELTALDLRYQVLIHGLRDLAMVDEHRGAEMVIMRLCHLNQISAPSDGQAIVPPKVQQPEKKPEPATPVSVATPVEKPKPVRKVQPIEAKDLPTIESAEDSLPVSTSDAAVEPDLPLQSEASGHLFGDWEQTLAAYHEIKPGVTAMLEHVGLLEFGQKIRLSLDKHQQNAIAAADRLAFQEWVGREVFWEAAQDAKVESLSANRTKQAESEKRRLWEQAESDPHLKSVMDRLDVRLTDVRAPGVEHSE